MSFKNERFEKTLEKAFKVLYILALFVLIALIVGITKLAIYLINSL